MERGARFSQRNFLYKGLKKFGREGRDALTKDMDHIYRQTYFRHISIKYLIPQEKRRYQQAILIPEKNIKTKTQRNNSVQWKTN